MRDTLYVALTRPTMRWGVTFGALLSEVLIGTFAFLWSHSLAMLLIVVPIHGINWLICYVDPRLYSVIGAKFKFVSRNRSGSLQGFTSYSSSRLKTRTVRELFKP